MVIISKGKRFIFWYGVFTDGCSGEVAVLGACGIHIRHDDKGITEAAMLCLGIDELAVLDLGTVEDGSVQLDIIHHAVHELCTCEYRTVQIPAG